jgi:hypothetical protein
MTKTGEQEGRRTALEHEDLTEQIIGAAIEVPRRLGLVFWNPFAKKLSSSSRRNAVWLRGIRARSSLDKTVRKLAVTDSTFSCPGTLFLPSSFCLIRVRVYQTYFTREETARSPASDCVTTFLLLSCLPHFVAFGHDGQCSFLACVRGVPRRIRFTGILNDNIALHLRERTPNVARAGPKTVGPKMVSATVSGTVPGTVSGTVPGPVPNPESANPIPSPRSPLRAVHITCC